MDQPSGWEGILEPGETIVWQGRPDGALQIPLAGLGVAAFGVLFAGSALFWMVMAARSGGFFWMFGLIHFGAGVSLILGALLGPTLRRRRTWYTLTTRRAFVATALPLRPRSLRSWRIEADTPLRLIEDDLVSIRFGTTYDGETRRMAAFERLHDGRAVYRLMRNVQEEALT